MQKQKDAQFWSDPWPHCYLALDVRCVCVCVCDLTHTFVCNEEQCNNNAKILGTIVQNLARDLCTSAIAKIVINSVDYHFGNILRMGVMNEVPCASCFLCYPRILLFFLSSFLLSTAVFCDVQVRLLLHFQQPFSVMYGHVCFFLSHFFFTRL